MSLSNHKPQVMHYLSVDTFRWSTWRLYPYPPLLPPTPTTPYHHTPLLPPYHHQPLVEIMVLKEANSYTMYMVLKEVNDLVSVRYCVPEFPHSSATFNIILGSCILAFPEVLQGSLGNSACPMQCSQPYPMWANRHLTGLTWFPIVLYYIK